MAKATRKKDPVPNSAPGPQGNHEPVVLDISHEEVPNPPPAEENKEASLKKEINNQIVKLGIADAGIAALKEKYGTLTIAGVDDKEGYEAVKKAWGEVRTVRTSLAKKGVELRSDYTIITKAIKGEEDRLIKSLSPLEESLEKQWKAIDTEKEAEKERKKKEDEDRLNERIQKLRANGMELRDGFYQLGNTISMDVVTLRALPDQGFEKLLDMVTKKKEELDQEQQKENERKQKEKEEQERQQKLIQEQQDKLKRDQEEMERQQKELENQRQELLKQKQEAENMRRELRTRQLEAIGFIRMADGSLRFETPIMENAYLVPVSGLDIEQPQFEEEFHAWRKSVHEENENYNKHLQELARIAEQKEKEEEEQRMAREKKHVFIASQLQEAGMVYDAIDGQFKFKNEADEITIKPDFMEEWEDAAIQEKAKKISGQITAAKKEAARLEDDRKKKEEQDRQDKLSDDEKIKEYIDALKAVKYPGNDELKQENSIIRVARIVDYIAALK